MNSKKIRQGLKRTVVYILISIPMTFALVKVIEYKVHWLFWLWIGIMGISGLIAEDYILFLKKKNKFIQIMEHIAFISAITLFLWYVTTNN